MGVDRNTQLGVYYLPLQATVASNGGNYNKTKREGAREEE